MHQNWTQGKDGIVRYRIVDVFAERIFDGNPLAVVECGPDMPRPELRHALAGEFNLSETIFLGETADGVTDARIHTPGREVPFAGHPLVGVAAVLAELSGKDGNRLRTPAGVFDMHASQSGGRWVGSVSGDISYRYEAQGLDIGDLRGMVGLAPGGAGVAPMVDCGIAYALLEVDGAELKAARPPQRADLESSGLSVFAYSRPDGEASLRVEARMFAPLLGVAEDPVTGSAALSLALFLAQRDGGAALSIHQGPPGGRGGLVRVRAEGAPGSGKARFSLSGGVLAVAEGRLNADVFKD